MRNGLSLVSSKLTNQLTKALVYQDACYGAPNK